MPDFPSIHETPKLIQHRNDPDPRFKAKIIKNSKSWSFEATVENCETVKQLLELTRQLTNELMAEYGSRNMPPLPERAEEA